MKKRTKTILLCSLILIVAAVSACGIWFLTREKELVGSGNVLDVAWYDETGTEFTITTVKELYEFAELSQYYNFKDQTIKLGADIVVNEGNAVDWAETFAENMWTPIEGFAGTFDGQGHSISGICGKDYGYTIDGKKVVQTPMGLFVDTQKECVIRDFKLLNSYFCSDSSGGTGSIAGYGVGTFDSIYSDAVVVGYSNNNGGILGMISGNGSATITNCWFDGEVRVDGNVGRFTGGIVGRVTPTNGQNKVEHCLNTGDISAIVTGKGVNMAGIIGNVQASARVNLLDCLNVGQVTNEYGISVGSIIGSVELNASVNIDDVYTQTDCFRSIIGNVSGNIIGAPIGNSEAKLTGFESVKWTALNFEEYWAVVEDGTPILQYFAEEDPSVKGIAKGYDTSWYDKSKNEFTLTTLEEVYGFAYLSYETNFTGKTIKLGADIVVNTGNATDWLNGTKTNEWIPIGAYGYPFVGKFDGQMHIISGIYLNESRFSVGLFGSTGENAVVQNLKLTNSYIATTGKNVGSIAGTGGGTFNTIYSEAYVLGADGNVSGLVGTTATTGMTMTNCWYNGTVVGTGNKKSSRITGGLVGIITGASSISNSLNTGVVDASGYTFNQGATGDLLVVPVVGGLVGNVATGKALILKESINVGEVKISDIANTGYGSVIGYVNGSAEVTYVYATTESCTKQYAGNKIAGAVHAVAKSAITGFKGYQWTLLDFDKYWSVVKTDTPILKSFAPSSPSISGYARMIDVSWYDAAKTTYVLYDAADLNGFAVVATSDNFAGKTVQLGRDIILNKGDAGTWGDSTPSNPWTSIGSKNVPFAGTFDGCMHTISGLYMNTDVANSGLFGRVGVNGIVKNVKLTNSYLESTTADCGSIAGVLQGTLDTVYSDAIVVGAAARIGGLVGHTSTGDVVMKNCWYDGTVTNMANGNGLRGTGGLVGMAYSGKLSIDNCLNSGTVDALAYQYDQDSSEKVMIVALAGGLLGNVRYEAAVQIDDCLNTGDVLAVGAYGSITGYADGAITVSTAYVTEESCEYQLSGKSGKVTGKPYVVSESEITGYDGHRWTLLDFDNYWAVALGDTPILKSFASPVPSLVGVNKMVDISWYDESKSTYVLCDATDLYGFALLSEKTDYAGKTVKLGADIVVNTGTASEWEQNAPDYSWTPISSFKIPFAGTFDGCMHSISGLYMDVSQMYSGLFAVTSTTAVIQNLKLTNSYLHTTGESIGSIVGCGRGTFETIYSDAIVVSSRGYVGGMIGQAATDAGVMMENCWFDGNVTATGNTTGNRRTAGLIGYVRNNSTITSCLNTGTIDASAYTYNQAAAGTTVLPLVGGFVGNVAPKMTLTISDSLNAGEIKYSSSATSGYGSIVGFVDGKLNASYVYATKESCKASTNGGTFTGKIYQMSEDEIAGFGGYQWTFLDFEQCWAVVLEGTPILKSFAKTVPSLDDVERMIDISWYDESQEMYVLYDVADLYGLAMLSAETDFADKIIKLGADIVVNTGSASEWAINAPSYSWTPIGSTGKPFAGIFNGCMHTISGLYLNTSQAYTGLFSATSSSAVIKNLKLTNSYMQSSTNGIGSIVAYGRGKIDTVYSDAIVVSGAGYVAGMVAQVPSTAGMTMENCWFNGSVTSTGNTMGNRRTAGLIAYVQSNSTIISCLNTGTIDASAYIFNQGTAATGATVLPLVGGFVGNVASGKTLTISDSLNVGEIKYSSSATNGYGSIVGYLDGNITSSYVYATTESCKMTTSGRAVSGEIYQLGTSAITGYDGYRLTQLDFDTYWAVVLEGTPILQSFAETIPSLDGIEKMMDTSWYDENESTYVLKDASDLYGLAKLSSDTDFAGKTIKLDADIVVNTGKASNWGTKAPSNAWTPIGSANKPFAGTFDGCGHSISGIYMKSTAWYSGMFSVTSADAIIQNFKLTNSYMSSTRRCLGSIVGYGCGKLEKIYSDAIVVSSEGNVGGIIGQVMATGSFTMLECWFNGTVTATGSGNYARRTGGLIGLVSNSCIIKYCLNSGTIDASRYTYKESTSVRPMVGGLIGNVASGKKIYVDELLNVGEVKYNNSATEGYGSVVGYMDGSLGSGSDIYATIESCEMTTNSTSNINRIITTVPKADITGTADTVKEKLSGFNFETYWSLVENGTPVLTVFQ